MDVQRNNTTIGKEKQKLKFGIDRLLAPEPRYSYEEVSQTRPTIANSLPTIAIPCSDCVTSLFRCCRLSPSGGNSMEERVELFNHHQGFGASANSNIFTVQPIRPFATRPAIRIPMQQQQSTSSSSSSSGLSIASATHQPVGKRKRSWSRAVFSNLQRKGLERRFQLQKYITKPDRRQLAATLGLTDAQVKVWFQNRRMKWRHSKESSKSGGDSVADSTQDDVLIDVDTVTEAD